jgi:hypothetical protein
MDRRDAARIARQARIQKKKKEKEAAAAEAAKKASQGNLNPLSSEVIRNLNNKLYFNFNSCKMSLLDYLSSYHEVFVHYEVVHLYLNFGFRTRLSLRFLRYREREAEAECSEAGDQQK